MPTDVPPEQLAVTNDAPENPFLAPAAPPRDAIVDAKDTVLTEASPVVETPKPEEVKNEEVPFKKRGGSRFSVGLTTGANLLARRYKADGDGSASALNTAVGAAAGASVALHLDYRIGSNFSVSGGLEYHRTLNPFRYVTRFDTAVAHPSELNSGSIAAVATRTVTHNHRLHLLTVPVTVYRNWTFGNLDLGLGAGLGLNFRPSATGKTLDRNGRVAAYDAANGEADVPDFYLSYRLGPMVTWRPTANGKLRLVLRANAGYQSFGASPLSGVKQNGWLLNCGIGMRYTL